MALHDEAAHRGSDTDRAHSSTAIATTTTSSRMVSPKKPWMSTNEDTSTVHRAHCVVARAAAQPSKRNHATTGVA